MVKRDRRNLTAARDAMIVQMRRDGSDYAVIAHWFGLTEARVCQIVTTANRRIPNRPPIRSLTTESSVHDLPGLGTRELNCLEYAGITTVGQLVGLNDNEMLALPGFGRRSLARVRRALGQFPIDFLLPLAAMAIEICCAIGTLVYADNVTMEWMM